MADETGQNKNIESLFQSFLKSPADFWLNFSSSMPSSSDKDPKEKPVIKNRFLEQLQTNLNLMKSLSQVMSEPESAKAAGKSISTLPDIILKMVQSSLEAGLQTQKHILEKAGKIGQHTEAYSFENLDQEVFKAFTDIYEKELRQYLHIPKLGLTRFYQERLNTLLDKQNIFETTLAEFLSVLYLPIEKSFKVLQEKLQSMAEEGVMPRETKEHYAMWIKILEGHYMTLFKSKEYTDALHNTINKLEDFILAKDEAMRDFLQLFPVPTNKEMDELYKEFHVLKKRVSELEKKAKSE
jgi:polyhydroxyalkanoate synthesis regulator phasin